MYILYIMYNGASNCLTSAHKRNTNNYYIVSLRQDRLVVFLQNRYLYSACHLQMQKQSVTFRNTPCCIQFSYSQHSLWLRRYLANIWHRFLI